MSLSKYFEPIVIVIYLMMAIIWVLLFSWLIYKFEKHEVQVRQNHSTLEYCKPESGGVCLYWTECSLAPFDTEEERACTKAKSRLK